MKYHYEISDTRSIYLKPTARNEQVINLTPYLKESPHERELTNMSYKLSSFLLHHPKILVAGGHRFEDLLLEKFKDYNLTGDARAPLQLFKDVDDLLNREGAAYYVIDVGVMLFESGSGTAFKLRLSLYKVTQKAAHEIDGLLRVLIIDQLLDDLCDTTSY